MEYSAQQVNHENVNLNKNEVSCHTSLLLWIWLRWLKTTSARKQLEKRENAMACSLVSPVGVSVSTLSSASAADVGSGKIFTAVD